jgi:hypothetical protein
LVDDLNVSNGENVMFPASQAMIDAVLTTHFDEREAAQRRPFYSGLTEGEPTSPNPSPDDNDWFHSLTQRTVALATAAVVFLTRA